MDVTLQLNTNAFTIMLIVIIYLLSVLFTRLIEKKSTVKIWWEWVPVLNTIASTFIAIVALVLWIIDLVKKKN